MRGLGLTRRSAALTATGLSLVATAAMLPATAIAGPFPGCNATSLAAQDLSGCDLTNTDLSGKNLSGKNLSVAKLPVDLTGVDFSNANLSRAYLTRQNNLAGANLSGAHLADIVWKGIRSGGIIGEPTALPSGVRLLRGYLVGPSTRPEGADLSGLDLSGMNLSNSTFWTGNLSRADLSGTNLTNVGFGRTTLEGTIFSNSTTLKGIEPGPIFGKPKSLPLGWTQLNNVLFGPGVDLQRVEGGADLSNTDLRGLDLGAVAGFQAAWLDGANVDGCDLASTIGFGYGARHGTAPRIVGKPKSLPRWVTLVKGYLIGPKMFLPSALLEDADLSGLILTDANLAAAVLRGANLTGFDSGGDYVPTDDAASAQAAAKTPLAPGARMFRSILTNANITNAKLRYAGLAGVITGGLRGKPKYLPTGWMLAKGYLIGPKANLTGAKLNAVDFKTTNLAGTKLTGADLTGAKLSKAKLTGVISSGLVGKPASLPAGWKIDRSGRLYKS